MPCFSFSIPHINYLIIGIGGGRRGHFRPSPRKNSKKWGVGQISCKIWAVDICGQLVNLSFVVRAVVCYFTFYV